ncbi:MAG: non-canonical purine NTP pyrophosphatase, partial [Nanoarchaeota archaeon]|nr:non-canonical purine NTP pyrophosphatase [Nanoarchaeota archaeon]
SNHGKFLEIEKILKKHGINASHINLDADEEGNTLEERCLSKARNAFSSVKKPLIVDDTGVFFEAYENFPGPFPKKVFQELGLDGILKKLEGKRRDAYFKSLICYMDENETLIFEGVVQGIISEFIYEGGHEALPYDRILIPSDHTRPFCEFTREEKNMISHRAKAVEKFAQWFCSRVS